MLEEDDRSRSLESRDGVKGPEIVRGSRGCEDGGDERGCTNARRAMVSGAVDLDDGFWRRQSYRDFDAKGVCME